MLSPRTRRRALPFALAILAGLGLVFFRYAGTRWPRGEEFDLTAVQDGLTQSGIPRVNTAVSHLLDSISVGTLLAVGGVFVGLAIIRHRADVASACVVALVGANVTTMLLKHELASRTVAGGVTRSFPSGHATAAMSIALAALLAAPTALQLPAAVVGMVYAAAVGVATVVPGWHFPSDVGGGFCVGTMWAALAALLLRRANESDRLGRKDLLVLFVVLAAVIVGVGWSQHPGLTARVRLHLRVVEAAVGIAVLAGGCVGSLLAVVAHRTGTRVETAGGEL